MRVARSRASMRAMLQDTGDVTWHDERMAATATRVSSARLVGRTAELAELEAVVHDAAEGRPSLAFVAGESGVGKSRLVDELIRRARGNGARVLSGDCVELGEDELPYAPLVSALRPLVRSGDAAIEELPVGVRDELAAVFPPLGSASADSGPAAQGRLFEALLILLDRLAEDGHVLLVIEDLHWADRSTRAFLTFLARALCGERIAVVTTYRPDELHRRHPLRPVLAELERDPRARRIVLPPFTRDELVEQLGDILGAPPDRGLAERLHARSEGNPLFTEEILAAGLDGRGALPPTLRDALMVRIERLPTQAQELLRLLVSQPMDHELLAQVSGLDARVLRDGLREAIASHIIVADEDDRYKFRHALLREVVYDDLLPGERTELHRTSAVALEQRLERNGPGVHLTAQIAHHWWRAGDQPAALSASVRAAGAAERVNAWGESAALLERALELWDRVDDPERLAGADQVSLLVRAANAADAHSDDVRHEALLQRAVSLIDAEADPRRAAAVLERLQRAQWHLNRQEDSIATIDRALALLEPDELTRERAALLAAKARARMLQARYREADEIAQEALDVAHAAGDHKSESRAMNSRGFSLMGLGDIEGGTAAMRAALEIARRHELFDELSSAYCNLADMYHLAGRSAEALELITCGTEDLTSYGRRTTWLQVASAEYAFALGDWADAEARVASAGSRHVGTSLLHWRMRTIELGLGRGDHDAVRGELEQAARSASNSTEPQFVGPIGAMTAELERRTGALDAARVAIDDTLDRIEFCSDDIARVTLVAAVGMRVEADIAQQARDRDDGDAMREATLRAELLLTRIEAAAEDEHVVHTAELASARAEDARARGEDDPELWDAAADAWDALSRPYLVAYAHWREAEAALGRGDRERATCAAKAACEIARRLGSRWLHEEVESLAARGRLRLDEPVAAASASTQTGGASGVAAASGDVPHGDGVGVAPGGGVALRGGTQPPSRTQVDDPFGLTPRERQVLTLVAGGATNREIGASLYMAEKTASVHVSRILAKLDVRSRTQAAAVAHRLGL
ncbi:MAG: transcriptional regulator, LuxR family, partial [Conexibacter sp.]|nr:transcriptional regulator, LuxR family [Conexibacter sp.]